jgi:hypothetical protein
MYCIRVGEIMVSDFRIYTNEYLAYIHAITFDFGVLGKGISKIKYYVNQ